MNTFLTVFKKELTDSVRDRRTITMIIVASILTGPLVLWMLSSFISSLSDKAEARKIYVAGQQYGPTAVNFFLRQSADVLDAPADYQERVKDGKLDAVVVFEEGFEDDLRGGRTASVELVYDDSRSEAGPSIGLARNLINGFGREQSVLRLVARGVSPEVLAVVKIDNTNLSTPKQRAAQLLFIIPMTTLILCLTGGLAVAIDCTAGERERGSLEPLLLNPVKFGQLVLGKWGAVSVYASAVVLLAIMGYVVTLLYLPIKIDLPLNFAWREFGLFALIAIPLAAMMGAAQHAHEHHVRADDRNEELPESVLHRAEDGDRRHERHDRDQVARVGLGFLVAAAEGGDQHQRGAHHGSERYRDQRE